MTPLKRLLDEIFGDVEAGPLHKKYDALDNISLRRPAAFELEFPFSTSGQLTGKVSFAATGQIPVAFVCACADRQPPGSRLSQ